ncbi:ABC transporter substrate-binding protein [Winogradskyella sp. PC-19]|uniref:type IX secretion system anionic LPS delivery protein PorZ n=1 Tax=unclassified Winogradskyella TaxID=2615021 RepID=UPI000B3BEFDE|nr:MULTISPECIES: two-component regulator propeller domain-containing protein [unclassified Winogradskyella]ARV09549.1 ABC transporter substrate-binding protein [Winogradskyella sp. PC-19]RZN83743.1 MAG: ABC transporter substrate-binding protein [Winogradskyella sp.]
MLKRYFLVCILTICFVAKTNAQDFSALWQDYFSFFDIVDVTRSDFKIYAASENVIFSYDVNSNEVEKITTIQGLSGELISTIEFSEENQLLLIGYKNGLIEVYFESDKSVLTIVDILEKESIDPSTKAINDFNEDNGFAYISTDFGISVYDLERLEFGDTYFIGNNNTQIPVEKTTVFNDFIYAACNSGNGIRKGALTNPNLIDSNQWQTITGGSYVSIETVENRLYGLRTDRNLIEFVNDALTPVFNFSVLPLDSEAVDGQLLYTTPDSVFIFNSAASLTAQINQTAEYDTNFASAVSLDSDIFIATSNFGVLQTNINDLVTFNEIRPDGPLLNNGFRIQAFRNGLWVTFGEHTNLLNPYPLNSRGISILRDEQWNNKPFESLLGMRELNKITINPENPNQVFVSSFIDGMLEFNNFEATNFFDETNSPLQSLIIPSLPDLVDIRTGASAFDDEGNLWNMTSRVDLALKSYNPSSQQWRTFSFENFIVDPVFDELGFYDLAVDNNTDTKWIASLSNGLIAFNENESPTIKQIKDETEGLPTTRVRTLALDNSGQLWIGTTFGLRVLFNTSGFFEDEDVVVEPIIFLEDGLARELLESQTITDIEVDGSNNKWIGTFDSGVFYVTPNGQSTIYHFTKDNSPLPTNAINDISIDDSNGTVYFSTPNGLLSFRAGGSATVEELSDAYAYPNPVRPEYNILGANDLNDINKGVKIVGLTENVNVKITDVTGNLVAEAQSRVNRRNSNLRTNFAIDGGTGIWNGKNLANNIVASGVYLIIINDLDTFESKILKLLIIR